MRGGGGQSRLISRYNTTLAAVEDPITPPVSVKYNQLLINGQFVDAASGMNFFSSLIFSLEFLIKDQLLYIHFRTVTIVQLLLGVL